MEYKKYTGELTTEMLELLLSADPDLISIQRYLPNSSIIVCIEKNLCVGIAVLSISDNHFELKNIAVMSDFQGQGIAKHLILEVSQLAKKLGANRLEVGTGNSSLDQLALYQKCGFRITHIEKDFFENYPEPIYENGIRCIDMVRLEVDL